MADVFTKKKRSWVMSKIGSRTLFEAAFLKRLSTRIFKEGFRYRKHYKKLPGRPDIVFVNKKIAIFLDGDFWHGYTLSTGHKLPRKYWLPKIRKNIRRDQEVRKMLTRMGWKVLRFWEHHVEKNPEKVITKIYKIINSRSIRRPPHALRKSG